MVRRLSVLEAVLVRERRDAWDIGKRGPAGRERERESERERDRHTTPDHTDRRKR